MRICLICLVPFCVYCSDLYISALPSFCHIVAQETSPASLVEE